MRDRIPVWSLLLLGRRGAGDQRRGCPAKYGVDRRAAGRRAGLVAVFLFVDVARCAAVLPPTRLSARPLKWIYLTLGMLMAATMVDCTCRSSVSGWRT